MMDESKLKNDIDMVMGPWLDSLSEDDLQHQVKSDISAFINTQMTGVSEEVLLKYAKMFNVPVQSSSKNKNTSGKPKK